MDRKGTKSVIHRMAAAGRDGFDARAMSPSKALRLSLAKAADTLFGLALKVTTVEQRRLAARDLEGTIGDGELIMLLDGRSGGRGAVILDMTFLSALIEMQTMGRLRPGAPDPRALTRTDAAIAAPLADALLKGYDAQMQGADPGHRALELRYGDKLENARSLALTLEGTGHDMFRISVDIGEGAKSGSVTVLLPEIRMARDAPAVSTGGAVTALRLKDNAMNAPVTLDAVVARIRLPLNDLWALAAGSRLPIDRENLENTQLLGARGHWVADVRLGQVNGWRAVRLISGGPAAAQPKAPPGPAKASETSPAQDPANLPQTV